jgi:hypothetical protein
MVARGTAATLGGRDTEAAVITFTLPAGVPAADLPPLAAAAAAVVPAKRSRPGPATRCPCSAPWPAGPQWVGDTTAFRVHGGGLIIGRAITEFGIARRVTGALEESLGPAEG